MTTHFSGPPLPIKAPRFGEATRNVTFDLGDSQITVGVTAEPYQLVCHQCDGAVWCGHLNRIMASHLDRLEMGMVAVPLVPTKGAWAGVLLVPQDTLGPPEFQGTVYGLTSQNRIEIPNLDGHITFPGDWTMDHIYPYEGRMTLRALIVDRLTGESGSLICASKTHPWNKPRKFAMADTPRVADLWSLLVHGFCSDCTKFLDTSQDVPDL
jgi:hypothetical protein